MSIVTITELYFFSSFFLGLRPSYPHFLQRVAFNAFLALHFLQIWILRVRASASGNLAMISTSDILRRST